MHNKDKLLTFHEKLTEFFDKNIRLILLLIFALIGIGVLWGGISYYVSKKEKKAALELMQAVSSPNMFKSLQEIKNKYRGTSAALQASLLLWNYYFEERNYKKMLELLKDLKDRYPSSIKGVLLYGEAKILENQHKWRKALAVYQEVVKKEPDLNFFTYLDIARAAEKIKNIDLAREYYKKSLQENPLEGKGFIEYKLAQLAVKK